jgi:hypothetical protein
MPRTRPPYSPGFRSQMVDLVRAGRSPEDLAREFEPTAQSIAASAVVADKQEGRREEVVADLSATERDELARETGGVPSAMRVPAPLHGDTACDLGSADAFEREAERGAFIHGAAHPLHQRNAGIAAGERRERHRYATGLRARHSPSG